MYLQSFGQSSFVVFLIGAFFALFSTTFVATASNARLFADGLQIFKLRCYDGEESRQRMIKVGCVLLPAISVLAFITMGEPVKLVFIGAIAQGLMLPFLAIAALYFRHVRTDAALRPGTVWTFCLWFAAIAMMVAGGYQIRTKFGIL
jgi:manganese transport protein